MSLRAWRNFCLLIIHALTLAFSINLSFRSLKCFLCYMYNCVKNLYTVMCVLNKAYGLENDCYSTHTHTYTPSHTHTHTYTHTDTDTHTDTHTHLPTHTHIHTHTHLPTHTHTHTHTHTQTDTHTGTQTHTNTPYQSKEQLRGTK